MKSNDRVVNFSDLLNPLDFTVVDVRLLSNIYTGVLLHSIIIITEKLINRKPKNDSAS